MYTIEELINIITPEEVEEQLSESIGKPSSPFIMIKNENGNMVNTGILFEDYFNALNRSND